MNPAPSRESAVPAQYRMACEAYGRGDLAQAIALLRAIIAADPGHAGALNLLGIVNMQGGRAADAEALFARAVAAQPGDAGFHNSHASALSALGRNEEAVAAFRRALALDPGHAAAQANLCRLLRALGRDAEALPHAERLATLRPQDAQAHFSLGETLHALRRFAPAAAAFRATLALNPEFPDARFCLGNALRGCGDDEGAHAEYSVVIAASPEAAGAWANRCVVAIDLGRPQQALDDITRALSLKPGNPDFHNLHGNALHALNRHGEARDAYGRALALLPQHRNARFNIGLCHLVEGAFGAGWPQYEARWQTGLNLGRIDTALPEWDGAPTQAPVLVWGEQGIGDQILQLSVAADVARFAPAAVFALMPRLLPLARRSYPALRFIGLDQRDRAACTVQKAFWSAAGLVRRGLDGFPGGRAAYLLADPARVAALRQRIAGDGRPVIGLSWQSRAVLHSRLKSMTLKTLQPLLADARWRFVDLQYGDTAAERAAVGDIAPVQRLDDLDPVNDVDGLAALIAACDAVVTISNVTAHLAGALGVPTLLMLPWSTGRQWYWHDGRDDSPWYPTLRIVRQSEPLRWDDVVARVCAGLPRLIAGGGA